MNQPNLEGSNASQTASSDVDMQGIYKRITTPFETTATLYWRGIQYGADAPVDPRLHSGAVSSYDGSSRQDIGYWEQ